ncbi:MAG: preprotein translocase subunit SecG [Spirochaetales bacterium]
MAILSGFLLVILFLSAVLLVIIVLMQDEQGEGLGGIFGGGSATPVGNRSGNILTRATSIIAVVFLSSVLAYAWINRTPDQSNVEAAAREAEGETFLEWWATDEPVDLPENVLEPEAEMQAADDEGSDGEGVSSPESDTE